MNLCGERGDADKNDPEFLKALNDLGSIIDQYDPSCVYNMDEPGLFFLASFSLYSSLANQRCFDCRSEKKAKDRVTLVVCCNANRTERLPIAMIGKAKEPACISRNSWPIPYFQQKNVWIDVPTFNKWFDEVFKPHVQKRTGHKVMLTLDNAPGHSTTFETNEIRVVSFLRMSRHGNNQCIWVSSRISRNGTNSC